jgi:tetratricopeptide (TPR) repeat protein
LSKIEEKIGGHPFLLNQINILVREEELTWDEIADELDMLVFSETENQKTFYNSLFEKHVEVVGESLACLKWINSKKIDFNLLKVLIGSIGIKKLERRSFFNIQNNFSYTLHDLVFDSLIHVSIPYDVNIFKQNLKEKLSKWYLEYSQSYFRVIYSHSDLIGKLLNLEKYDVFSYAYINALPIDNFPNKVIQNYSVEEIKNIFETYSNEKYFELFTWIELIEKEYLFKKKTLFGEELSGFLTLKIEEIESYLLNSNLSKEIYIEVQNHLAKHYRNSGNKEKAVEIFEDIISKQSDYWVAKLHLSKLIRFDNGRKEEAEKLIQEILEAFKDGKEVSSTVVLAAYIEIRSYKKLEEIYLIDLIENFQELINSVLVDKFDMPYKTLSALSSRIQFKYPDKMIKMTEELPIPSEESVEKNILFDIGQIYFNTSKAYFDLSNSDEALKNANVARVYFDKMSYKSDYHKRIIAENYLLLNEDKFAISLLNEVDKNKIDIWWKYTYSKALSLSGEHKDALALISECIDIATYSQDTFYRERANIKIRAGENPCDDLKVAYDLCGDEKFKRMILEEITQNKC